MLNGISLSPWIMCKLDIEVVKKFITTVEDEEGEDGAELEEGAKSKEGKQKKKRAPKLSS